MSVLTEFRELDAELKGFILTIGFCLALFTIISLSVLIAWRVSSVNCSPAQIKQMSPHIEKCVGTPGEFSNPQHQYKQCFNLLAGSFCD